MRARGFTLIELVITLAIVGLMATAAMPLAQLVAKREKESELRAALREIRSAIDAYKVSADTGHMKLELGASGYPPDLKSLYVGVEDAASEKKVMMYFLRRVPRDPFFPDGAVAAEETWGLRSYASPPDDPQPGDDVFDVYSLAKGDGLNGVHYHDW
jgi:general secretion pathway protein G